MLSLLIHYIQTGDRKSREVCGEEVGGHHDLFDQLLNLLVGMGLQNLHYAIRLHNNFVSSIHETGGQYRLIVKEQKWQ